MVATPMHPRIRGVLRLLKRLVSLVAILVLLIIIVTSIAGLCSYWLAFTGRADHAGAANGLAFRADLLDGGTDFHDGFLGESGVRDQVEVK